MQLSWKVPGPRGWTPGHVGSKCPCLVPVTVAPPPLYRLVCRSLCTSGYCPQKYLEMVLFCEVNNTL